MKNNVLSRFSIFLKGMAMGIADIIPGVSGGIMDQMVSSIGIARKAFF